MTSPRTRIGRLAQSVGLPPVHTPCMRKHATTAASTSLSRAFDTGEPVGLYADTDPTSANDLDPTQVQTGPSPAPGTLATLPATAPKTTSPALIEAPAETPLASTPAATAPLAAAPAVGNGSDVGHLDGSATRSDDEVAGWTVPQAADASDQAFAEDIQAILAHAQSVSGTGRVALPDVPSPAPVPPPPAVAYGVGAGATHDIFDQMAAANAPSTFNQGPVALSVDFDRLDRALDDVITPPPSSVGPSAAPAAELVAPTEVVGPVSASPSVAPARPAPTQAPQPAPTPSEPVPATPVAVNPAETAVPETAEPPFRVTTDVPLLPQAPGLSCHAAACASLVAWRDEVASDSAAVAAGTGYWERFAGGRTATYPDVLEVFGLANASIGRPPTAAALRDLLDTSGPLFVAAAPPGEHAVIVAGITGDGTANGTIVDVVDPWAKGMTTYSSPNPGSQYSVPYSTLLEAMGSGPEHEIVIAHLRKGSS
jgi:hypothetical protein